MADQYEYIVSTGVVVPDTAETLLRVQNEFKTAFGSDLVVTPDTPQGVLITAETLARDNVIKNNAALANQINPNIAGGVFLDAICELTALERDLATKSTVSATVSGTPSTLIPAGSRAQTVAGDLFETTGDVTLDGSGNGTASFQSVDFGPIPAAMGALSQITTGVLGWENVSNGAAATLGQNVQSDLSLRQLRKVTLALQGTALPEAIISVLYAVPEVKSLTFRENITASTATIDGVSLVAHSIYACVDGGTDLDVATALLSRKSLGGNWNGGVTVNVTEPASGQVYAVKFARPTLIPIKAQVTVTVNTSLLDPNTVVKQAILDYAAGLLEGEPGFIVGGDVSPFELAGAINREAPGIYVRLLEIAKVSGGSFDTVEIPIAINELATIIGSNITVIVA